MEKQEHLNTFQKGLIQDFDKLQVSNQSYIYSTGGRIIFNEDGTYAWENDKGTKFAFQILADYGASTSYQPIGGGEINSKLIVFSTNGTNSEIGLVTEEQYGVYTYQTIFNDKYDPYGDLLNFQLKYQTRDFQRCVENVNRENIYFNDDYNEPRVFNVVLGLQRVSPQFVDGDYRPLTATGKYPTFYSVHGMSLMIDLTWGKLKYKESILGSLLSGQYQYAYRYVHQTGYVSPWSPLSGFYFVTTDIISSNWTEYQMQESNTQTDKGNRLIINKLDTRFQEIEVAALYWVTETQPTAAYTFFKAAIPSNGEITVDHQTTGASITIDELVQRYTEVSRAKTGNMKDNTYHLANIETYPILEIDTSLVTAEPILRPMLSDETTDESTQVQPDGFVRGAPFTGQTPKNTTVTVTVADGLTEVYDIVNDYISYKGVQWASIFRGHFGGETYPFAFVLFDRKGQPMFAQHLTDFTFPQRYSNQWQSATINGVTTGTTGSVGDFKHTNTPFPSSIYVTDDITTDKWYLNLIGIKFSGIDLTDILYDANGKLQVSGFSIVRMDRIKQILGQGLMMSACATADENNIPQIVPCPTMFNGYLYNGIPYGTYSGPDETYVGQNPENYASGALPAVNQITYPSPVYTARPNMAMFECPDFFIGGSSVLPSANIDGDNMKAIGICVKGYAGAGKSGQSPWNLFFNQFYQKNYRTVVSNYVTAWNGTAYNQIVLGDPIDLIEWYPNIQSGQQIFGSLYFNTTPPVLNYQFWGNFRYLSRQIKPTCLFTCGFSPSSGKTVEYVGVLTDDGYGNATDGHGAYFIANYVRPAGTYTITQTLLDARTYYNIGHFIPINQSIVNTITAIPANNGRCIFNNVPVWGGDCFLDYWTYYRLYADIDLVNGNAQDYGIALSFPIESIYNIALRQGNSYDEFGPKPSQTYHGLDTWGSDGIYYASSTDQKVEDFNMNIVLSAKDGLSVYNAKPSTFLEIYDFPVREQYTGTKIYGELYDTYRRFPIGNFKDADGSRGEINSLQFIFNYLYVIQRNGFARVMFNEREAIVGETGTSLDIASNLGLTGFLYINNVYGTQHQFSVVNSGKALYWVDSEKGKAVRFSADGLLAYSDEYGLHNFFTTKTREYWKVKDVNNILYPSGEKPFYDNPAYVGGIAGVFDFKNQSLFYTFTQKLETTGNSQILTTGEAVSIEYNEVSNQFKDFSPFKPKLYFQYKDSFLSPNPNGNSNVYVHGEGNRGMVYTAYVNSKVRFVVNPANMVAKWFDNGSIAVNNAAASLKVYSATGTVEDMAAQTVTFGSDTRWKYLQGFLRYPLRAVNAIERLRGKSCIVELEVLNDSSNTTVRITSHMTGYRISPKT